MPGSRWIGRPVPALEHSCLYWQVNCSRPLLTKQFIGVRVRPYLVALSRLWVGRFRKEPNVLDPMCVI